ncbi:MAG: excinuclease ABC subunit UvrA [Pseudomonadota bacterium]|nr:excinuclease ABC subunit UvrA [Pseudomonadota bacterium]|tara:strand:- start:4131 stop:6992 length:2862 start_codon:yes stop_codon:yes gene_type:complete
MSSKKGKIANKKFINIVGAREHNLKNIDVSIPKDSITVITGLSGSGKSSLAFDTIYAEGQRRYVESLSAYARQFLEMMQKPDLDQIDGLSPAIAIEQKTTSKNPRSTVGTVTEVYDYLRLMFARIGIPHSPTTGLPIQSQTVTQMVDQVHKIKEGTKAYLLSPIIRGRKGEYRKEFSNLLKKGFQRVKIDGEFYELDNVPNLEKNIKHDIDVVVDRIVIDKSLGNRLADSFETALQLSDGLAAIELASGKENGKRIVYSANYSCPESGFTIEEIEPRLFSFNNPVGACQHCDGLGTEYFIDRDLVIPNKDISIRDGAIAPWSRTSSPSPYYLQTLMALSEHYSFSIDCKWSSLPEKFQKIILDGSENEKITFNYDDGSRTFKTSKPFEGILNNLKRRYLETDSNWMREEIEKYQSKSNCSKCNGYRLKEEALCIKINKSNIGDISKLTIDEAILWFGNLQKKLSKKDTEISRNIIKEITERLFFLKNVGLNYLTLSRESGTLSGGESQRIRLASQIGSGLTGVLYVLDEPSIGLHQRDNDKLLGTLSRLKDLGNTVIVVEHDEETMNAADHIIDIGPGAGIHGGYLVAEGTFEEIAKNKKSITGQYLSKSLKIDIPKKREINKDRCITITNASGNNLKNVTANFPLSTLTCVTGVSGSGKSTLLLHTLFAALNRKLNNSQKTPMEYDQINGIHFIDKIIDINQSPIGRTPRSNPATYTGAFTPIRDWFCQLPEAKARGYKPGRFSFNVKGGRCETCQGDGVIKIEMHFLPDVYVECDQCKGQRYNRETLEVKYKDKSIADVLNMTVTECSDLFKAVPLIRDKMETLKKVGLGYIKVGQQANTLSGGEAQRIKLAKELSKKATGRTFYVLDEPTTGLHFDDVKKLLEVLHELVENGNTVVVIEHNLDVIKTADWILDIGPDGGDKGGELVYEGELEGILKIKNSYTGKYLKKMM